MIFREMALAGAFVIEPERIEDDRGYFARTWCWDAFFEHGIDATFVQCNTSFNHRRGTLRGMHFQAPPNGEAKLIRCTRGRIFDVAVDLREGSPTRGRWEAVELSADSARLVYLPVGFAHGFQTLEDDSEVFYQMTAGYEPGSARGIRWDDPDIAIDWPVADPIMSERDRTQPLFDALKA